MSTPLRADRRVFIVLFFLTIAAHASAGTVTMCKSVGDDCQAVDPTTEFPEGTKDVYAVFKLDDKEKGKITALHSRWVAVDVGDVAEPNTEIGAADNELNGADRGKLSFTLPRPMPVGKYRLEVQADGKPWKTADFTVGKKK